MNPHSKSWRAGDLVSTGSQGQVTGKVMTFNRQADGKPYIRIQILSGGPFGKWEWPDGWVLGIGALAKTCARCSQPYRTEEKDSIFCLACDRLEDHDGADSQRSARSALRGTYATSQPSTDAGVNTDTDWKKPF
jgi:hypothetical protein